MKHLGERFPRQTHKAPVLLLISCSKSDQNPSLKCSLGLAAQPAVGYFPKVVIT